MLTIISSSGDDGCNNGEGGKGGGGRPDMAQGGGPDGAKAADAIAAVREALARQSA